MKTKLILITIVLLSLSVGTWAQTDTIVSMITTKSEGDTVRISTRWDGVGSITANGVKLENIEYNRYDIPVPADGKIELIATREVELTYLGCRENQLSNLDVSKCTELWNLYCGDNQLSSLDVSKCSKLWSLYCENNQLSNLDVSGCTQLAELWCFDNQLSNLDVSKCTQLSSLYCDSNQLTNLDVSGCTELSFVLAADQQINITIPVDAVGFKNPIFYKNQTTVEDVLINDIPYAYEADVPVAADVESLTFTSIRIEEWNNYRSTPFCGTITIKRY